MTQALIVDDSKTARVSLRKMLEKHDVSADLVECAEDALEYLRDKRPSMIFMDHMMPGMDGFDAVKAIKADPETAAIPIVMYTTKQGDIYVGQARALGAADILPKPADSESLGQVLNRIEKILQEQDKKAEDPITVEVKAVTSNSDSESNKSATNGDNKVREQAAAESIAAPDDPSVSFQTVEPPRTFFNLTMRQAVMLLIWLAPIVWLLILYLPSEGQRKQLLSERDALYRSVEWAINKSESYDYGEVPMSGQRLETLRGLVSHLAVAGFKGTIRLEGHLGEFCFSEIALKNGGVTNMLPSAQLPLSQCKTIGLPAEKAMELSGQQSDDFKQFLESSPLLESSGIKVEIVRFGASHPKYEYPEILDSTTVGDWNSVALSNNRVNFVLRPDL